MLLLATLVRASEPLDASRARDAARIAVDELRVAPGVVIGWVAPASSGVVGYGESGNPARAMVDGESAFELGSISKGPRCWERW